MKHRLQFAGKKLLRMALLLLGVILTAFLLMSASPLDPLRTNVGQAALGAMSPEQIAKLEDYWGVNTPPVERYLGWLSDFVRGDLGTSLLYRQPVTRVVGQRLQNSLWLMAAAWVLSGVLGLALGVIAGACRGRLPDRLSGRPSLCLLRAAFPLCSPAAMGPALQQDSQPEGTHPQQGQRGPEPDGSHLRFLPFLYHHAARRGRRML